VPTLERETELDCIAAARDSAADGRACVVVIEGLAGIGKTRLVADARALGTLRGFGRMCAVGDELESAMPWAVVRQLVERSMGRRSRSRRGWRRCAPTQRSPLLEGLEIARHVQALLLPAPDRR